MTKKRKNNNKHLFIAAAVLVLLYGLQIQFSAVGDKLGSLEVLGGQKMQPRKIDRSLKKLALVMEESQKNRVDYASDKYAFAEVFGPPEKKPEPKPVPKPEPEPVHEKKSPEELSKPKKPKPIEYLKKVASRLQGKVNGISDSGIFVAGRFVEEGEKIRNVPLFLEGEGVEYARLVRVDVSGLDFGVRFRNKTKTIRIRN